LRVGTYGVNGPHLHTHSEPSTRRQSNEVVLGEN
jgi:hypothetical protein